MDVCHRLALCLALALASCGGAARPGLNASSEQAGASNGGEGSAGAPAASSGGAGSDSGGAGGELSARGGQPAQTACVELSCLAGAELVYQPTREWHRPQAGVDTMSELPESDYAPLLGPPVALKFSDDAQQLQLTPLSGGATVQGTRDSKYVDRAHFDLNLFAGGRFEIKAGSAKLSAEYTTYGSGVPIISSTRGVVEPAP